MFKQEEKTVANIIHVISLVLVVVGAVLKAIPNSGITGSALIGLGIPVGLLNVGAALGSSANKLVASLERWVAAAKGPAVALEKVAEVGAAALPAPERAAYQNFAKIVGEAASSLARAASSLPQQTAPLAGSHPGTPPLSPLGPQPAPLPPVPAP
jgi:hypothetical protein